MSHYEPQAQGGLRRRGKTTKSDTNSNTMNETETHSGLPYNRSSMVITSHRRDDDEESDLDTPLIANEEGSPATAAAVGREQQRNSVRVFGDESPSDNRTTSKRNSGNNREEFGGGSSHSSTSCRRGGGGGGNGNNNSNTSNTLRGTLTVTNNGAWNRLSCVSAMVSSCLGLDNHSLSPDDGDTSSSSSRTTTVIDTARDVACAVIDKLPNFMANRFGPDFNKMDPKKQRFVDGFRAAFVVRFNGSDEIHAGIVKELYRVYYSICCLDADPLVDVSGYVEKFSPCASSSFGKESRIGEEDTAAPNNKSKKTADEVEAEGKDSISSEFWKLIGFQGTNPATDFRGGGVLSLLLLLHLFKNRPDLIRSIFSTRERAPNTPPPPRPPNSEGKVNQDPDFHFPPPFFVEEMTEYIAQTGSQSNQTGGGETFLTCPYPFAIAGINVAMHLMLLLGVETKKTCFATTENTGSYSSRLAKAKVLDVTINDNGNCSAGHDEHDHSCRPFLRQLVKSYKSTKSSISSSFSVQPSPASPTRDPHQPLFEGFDHFAAIFETAVALMHNEWAILPAKDKNILFFNQVLQRSREKLETMLRRCDNIYGLGKCVEEYDWVSY